MLMHIAGTKGQGDLQLKILRYGQELASFGSLLLILTCS
jgi:hypothetical protein